MTDRLQCPECKGSGQEVIGPLRMVCPFCRGPGYVGGDAEPGGQREPDPLSPRPVWEEPAVQILPVCRVCFGAGKVVNLGGTGEPTRRLVEMPCPACCAENGSL